MTNIEKKQNELKEWIIKIGMTQKYFIGQYCIEYFNSFTEEEIDQYYQKFKKEISRKTTKIEVLDKYFTFLYSLDEFKNIGYIKPIYVNDNLFDEKFNKKMESISQKITEQCQEKLEENI